MKGPTPIRWLEPGGDDAPEEARRLLEAAAPGPDAASSERVWRALEASLASAPSAPSAARAGSMRPVAGAARAAPIAGLKLLGVVVVAALTASPPTRAWRAAAPPPMAAQPTAPVAHAITLAPRVAFAQPAPSSPSLPTSSVPRLAIHHHAIAIEPPSLPSAPEPAAPPPPVVVPAPPSEPIAAAPVAPAAVADVNALEREAALIRQADDALHHGVAARALALADEHAAGFPSGMFVPERESIAIGALEALGRRDEALARAERFLRAYPRDTNAPRVRELRDRLLTAPR